MANLERYKQRRGLVAINGAMILIVIFLVAQVWLLSATVETLLAGHTGVVLPAAIFSGLAFLGCSALNLFVTRVDRESRKP
jgi:predicted Co/Zn/Cd cation transporter (cation efflux family)